MEPVCHRKQQADEAGEIIIPGLPHDLALHILALLPRALYSALGLVCRSWRNALRPDGPVLALRERLNISETWVVFVYVECQDVHFLFIDPAHCGCLSIVHHLPYNFGASSSSQTLFFFNIHPPMAVRSEILIRQPSGGADSFFEGPGPRKFHCFDVHTMQWKDCVSLTYSDEVREYATAAVDECVYLVGGTSISGGEIWLSKRVAKLDMRTRTWEILPDMQQGRRYASAAYLQGHLCFVGGVAAEYVYSGEIWDPSSRKWTLIPELWPASVFGNSPYQSYIASVKGTLYALRCKELEDVQELMYYEDASKSWISMGKFCFPALVEREHATLRLCKQQNSKYQMIGADEELLVICCAKPPVGRKCRKYFLFMAVLSTKPTLSQPITWKIWPLYYPAAAFAEPLILHV